MCCTNRIFLLLCVAILSAPCSFGQRVVSTSTTTKAGGQPKTLFWLSLLPLASRIQADEIAASANNNTSISSTLADLYNLNDAIAADEIAQAQPDLYPLLLSLYQPPYAAPYAPIALRQPYLSDEADADTVIRTEFIRGVLQGLQSGNDATSTMAADMAISTSNDLETNKLLRISSRKLSESSASGKKHKRRKLPFVLLDDAKFDHKDGEGKKKFAINTERDYNVYEIHVV